MRIWAKRMVLTGLILGGLVACAPQSSIPPTPTKTPVSIVDPARPTATPLATVLATEEPTAIPTEAPTAEPTPQDEPSPTPEVTAEPAGPPTETPPPPPADATLPEDTYCMARPIPEGWRDFLDRTYAYGGTSGGQYRPHTGVEFWNGTGTPVVAVGNGTVVHAGNDWEISYGPETAFYGNLIVLRLDNCTLDGQAVYALYGHLSEVLVEAEQAVPRGEIIGAVGGTGVANGGPHLHFEVRVGDPLAYFESTRNPDLWIRPYFGFGTLAGRVVDASGTPLPEVSISITGAAVETTRYAWTYAGAENIAHERWGENFTYGDLPEGWYTVTTRSETRTYTEEVYIRAGETAWVEFVFD